MGNTKVNETNEMNYMLAIKMITNFLKENWITKEDFDGLKKVYKEKYQPKKALLAEV